MCQTHKKPYQTQIEAITAINGELKKYGTKVKPYRCKFCKLWHVKTIGKTSQRRKRIIKRAIKRYVKLINGIESIITGTV